MFAVAGCAFVQRHFSPLSDPRSGKSGWARPSRRGLTFGDFVQKLASSLSPWRRLSWLHWVLAGWGSRCRYTTNQRDGAIQVCASDYYSSSVHPRFSDRGLEGDICEERPQLLAPDFPLSAACRWNGCNTEAPERKRLQMVKVHACSSKIGL